MFSGQESPASVFCTHGGVEKERGVGWGGGSITLSQRKLLSPRHACFYDVVQLLLKENTHLHSILPVSALSSQQWYICAVGSKVAHHENLRFQINRKWTHHENQQNPPYNKSTLSPSIGWVGGQGMLNAVVTDRSQCGTCISKPSPIDSEVYHSFLSPYWVLIPKTAQAVLLTASTKGSSEAWMLTSLSSFCSNRKRHRFL